jgi:hypothetical protein
MSKPTTHQAARSASTECELIRLHAQACNGLHAALKLLTGTSTTAPDSAVFSRALGRALRATSALKQACAEVKNSEVAR